jgi:3',5'-cyclic AMP phosphodiesterase CpdA
MNLPNQTAILQVSDTHLSPEFAASTEMWTAAVRSIEKSRPDLVIHTGDVVYDDPDSDRDHEFAAFQMRRLTTPWRIVPGNHGIGDSEPDPFRGPISQERLARFRRHFGSDRWSVAIGGWQLIGPNSLLYVSYVNSAEFVTRKSVTRCALSTSDASTWSTGWNTAGQCAPAYCRIE